MSLRKILFCCVVCAIVDVTLSAPSKDVQVIDGIANDLENWMGGLPDALRKVPIIYLAIPGTHDSFTSDITSKSDVSPDGEEILKKLEFLKIVKVVMANWSKTQAYNVVQQLQAGIRFFDLRMCKNSKDNNLYFCHGMYSTQVRSVLTDMALYLDNHPKEMVILDCQHFYNFDGATHAEVIQLLKTTFGDKLTPYQSSMDSLTLDNLATQNKQVLVIYRDSSQSGQALLWPSNSFPTPWYNTMNTSYLVSSLNNGLDRRSDGIGYVSQLILTPSVEDILGNVLSNLRQKCAVDFQNTRTQWISNQIPERRGVNVIIADFVDLSDNNFSKTVINLNSKLDTAKLNSVSIVDKIKRFFF